MPKDPDSQISKTPKDMTFVQEQYSQYHEIRRQLNSFSWQIPSIAVLAIFFFLDIDPDSLNRWYNAPLIPAIGFLVVGMFLIVLLVFHIRNIAILRNFESVLAKMEIDYGAQLSVYAFQLGKQLKWWQRLKSSSLLGSFVFLLILIAFSGSVFFWIRLVRLF